MGGKSAADRRAGEYKRSKKLYNGIFEIQRSHHQKIVHEGHWAVAGEDIYDVADMSTVWVIANIPEADVQNIKTGQSAVVTTVSYPGEEFFAKVNFISPLFNSETRTLEVRLDISNKNFKLKPDMFVKVSIKGGQYQWNIIVPRNAVLRTGKMDMIYIKKKIIFFPRRW